MRPIYPRESQGGFIFVLSFPPGNTGGSQVVTANANVSTRSTPFSSNCAMVTVTSNTAFFFEVGVAPTVSANTSSHYALANFPYDIALTAGLQARPDANCLAFMTPAGNAAIYISERF